MKHITSKIVTSISFCIIALAFCSLNADAKSKVTAMNGKQFYWTSELIDSTFVTDPISGQELIYISENKSYIYKVNTDSTYFMNQLDIPATFSIAGGSFTQYFQNSLLKVFHLFPSSIHSIKVNNVIVDTTGKVIYQDFVLNPDDSNFNIGTFRQFNENSYNEMLFELKKIMAQSPPFLPGKKNNKNVNVILEPIDKVAIKRW